MKKKLLKKIVCGVLFTLTVSFASAYSFEELVSEETAAQLLEKGLVQKKRMNEKSSELVLVPSSPLAQKFKNQWPASKKEKPVLVGENLYLIKKSELNPEHPESVTIEKASQIMRSISTMQGLEYYSNKNEKWETLYKDAYFVDNIKNRKKIADDIKGSADGKTACCLLNDNSLGKIYYTLSYHQKENEVSVQFENETDISLYFVTAVSKGNVRIGLDVIDCGDSFLVYALVQAKFPSIGFIESRLDKSLSARVDAIYKWFIKGFK